MSSASKPRRTPYLNERATREPGIHMRPTPDGGTAFEIGWRDASGKQRWKRVEGGVKAARAALAEDNLADGLPPDPERNTGGALVRHLADRYAATQQG